MKKEMKYKVLLCLLAGSVLSVNTALAAEYTETIKDGRIYNTSATPIKNDT